MERFTESFQSSIQSPLVLPAPAKLNLMLHITGRRPDGYHNLQTLFQFLDYGDELSFKTRTDGLLRLSPQIPGVDMAQNLIIKAAQLLRQQTGCELGADIELIKRLPMGGGLGGGSSDAATTLLALNELWETRIPLNELTQLGLTLGADVPVFVAGQAAFAEGVGEQLTPVMELDEPWYLVVHPGVHCDTREIFSHKCLTRNTAVITMRTALEQGGMNDCQQVAAMLYPEIGKALNLLNNFSPARMTGSGSCIFASFASKSEAIRAADKIQAEYDVFVAKGTNRSPTHKLLFRPS